MRILHVNKLYAPWRGGMERSVQTIAESLARSCRVTVACCSPTGPGSEMTTNGVRVRTCASLGMISGMPVSVTLPLQLRDLVETHDIIHFHMPFPLAALGALFCNGRLGPRRVVVHYHSDIRKNRVLTQLYLTLLAALLDRADRVVVTSPPMLECAGLQSVAHKCTMIPLPIDFGWHRAPPPETMARVGRQTGNRSGDRVVLFVGRFVHYKGIEYLIEAMRHVDARLVLVGARPLAGAIRRRVADVGLGARVSFAGPVPDDELVAYYELADVLVLPSIERTEAFGVVQLEAMAHGLPVINTRLATGVPWVSAHGETGLTVPPRDPSALADAIGTVLRDRRLAARFAGNGRERVKRFAADGIARQLREMYARL